MSDTEQRTEKSVRSQSNKYNDDTAKAQLIHEQLNAAQNWDVISKAYKAGRARDICDEPKTNKPAIIIGSGPSLDHSIRFLKDWKGGIACTSSHARTLIYHGAEPTYLVALDPFCYWKEIEGVDWSKTKTKLVTHPGIWPDLIAKWPNEILLYTQNPDRDGNWYTGALKHGYSWREPENAEERRPTFHFMLRTAFKIFASSPPLQMFVLDFLGYAPLFLAGCDFGFTGGKGRFTDWAPDETGKWIEHQHPYIPEPNDIMSNNGVPTKDIHLYYKKNFISAWRAICKTLYSTDGGIMPEVPYTTIEKLIQKQGLNYPPQSPEKIANITERYLASVGAYVINTRQGPKFIESANPWVELPNWMMMANREWFCTKCGAKAHANDDMDYTGKECAGCKEPAMARFLDCDVRGNMMRVDAAIRGAGK